MKEIDRIYNGEKIFYRIESSFPYQDLDLERGSGRSFIELKVNAVCNISRIVCIEKIFYRIERYSV